MTDDDTAVVHDLQMTAQVRITVNDREPIERVTGPGGDEWRAHMYPSIVTEDDVLEHWAANALDGIADICRLDGWADVPQGFVTMEVMFVERDV